MGTTLTGTTPQDTYDSLIKVTDNGPLSGTLKALSDGLGNDSSLSLSTTAASIAGNLTVTGEALFDTNTLFVDATNNRVGIGLTAPTEKLHIKGTAANTAVLIQDTTGYALLNNNNTSGNIFFGIDNSVGSGFSGGAYSRHIFSEGAYPLIITTNSAERMRIDSSGNVGIGVTPSAWGGGINSALQGRNGSGIAFGFSNLPVVYHTSNAFFDGTNWIYNATATATLATQNNNDGSFGWLSAPSGTAGSAITFVDVLGITAAGVLNLPQGQIKFPATQVPSADANTLDDYEEGTWTPTISFGGASVGVTYAAGRAGQYTKIGRQVTVTAYILLTSKGSSTGLARIGGLPFATGNATGYFSAGSLAALSAITYEGQIQAYAENNSTSYTLNDYSEAGVQGNITDADFSNVSQIIFTATYHV